MNKRYNKIDKYVHGSSQKKFKVGNGGRERVVPTPDRNGAACLAVSFKTTLRWEHSATTGRG